MDISCLHEPLPFVEIPVATYFLWEKKRHTMDVMRPAFHWQIRCICLHQHPLLITTAGFPDTLIRLWEISDTFLQCEMNRCCMLFCFWLVQGFDNKLYDVSEFDIDTDIEW